MRDYAALITSQHKDKPKFVALVQLLTSALGANADLLAAMPSYFDIDTAVGAQLDAVGLWVGVSRKMLVPISGAFFTFDDVNLGWDQANWKGPYEPAEGIVSLDDETYRVLLKARVAANYWDGSDQDLNDIGVNALSSLGLGCLVVDNFDMSVDIYIAGAPTAAMLELIRRGAFPPKTAGVRINSISYTGIFGAPFFGLDYDNTTISGPDKGAFLIPL